MSLYNSTFYLFVILSKTRPVTHEFHALPCHSKRISYTGDTGGLFWYGKGYPGGIVTKESELKPNSARSEKQGCGSKSIVQTVPFFKLI